MLQAIDIQKKFGDNEVLKGVTVRVARGEVVAIIGRSGSGKSTLLRCLNHLETIDSGEIRIDGENILAPGTDILELRRKVGMIFQKPTPFPMSVFDNVAYGMRLHYNLKRSEIADRVEQSLRGAAIWDEVKDKLKKPGTALSGGQQQRLCIARAIAIQPDVLLMDEPTSAIDPIGTSKIEDLIGELKKSFTIVIVTHNMQQAARVSDYTAFFYKGVIVEYGDTRRMFTKPREKKTEDYITGRFG